MKIIKYEKKKNNQYKIYLDDDYITIYDDVILNNNLLLKKSITPKELEKIIEENSFYDAYFKSLKYINRKLRSKKEIIKYLSKDYDKEIVDKTINRLIKEKYINDEIYTTSYIHDAINLTNKGYYKIQRELLEQGIDENIINNMLNEISNDIWYDKLNNIIDKKIKINKTNSINKLKIKLNYDLFNLGYSKEMINECLTNIECYNEDEILKKAFDKLYIKLSKKYQDKELELQIINKLLNQGFNYDDIKKHLANN